MIIQAIKINEMRLQVDVENDQEKAFCNVTTKIGNILCFTHAELPFKMSAEYQDYL